MKKRIKEILIITSICCVTLFTTTGCGLCYSCGSNATKGCDIVNIGLHFFLKNVRPYAASCSEA